MVSGITPPFGDLPNGYTVSEAEWNGQFNAIFDYLNNTLVPAVTTLQSAPSPDVGAQSFFNARLTLATGNAIPATDQSAKTTLYLTPYNGNLIGLYNPSNGSWSNYALSADISLAVPTAVRDLYDIFVYQSGGSLALAASGYFTQAATNNPTAGTSKTINMTDTSKFAIGDIVSISDGSGQEDCYVSGLVTNTSITVDWLINSYTSPTVRSNTRLESLTSLNGALLMNSDTSKRYIGTILVINSQCNDTVSNRSLANYHNRVFRKIESLATWAASYSVAASTTIAAGQNNKTLGEERILFVTPASSTTMWSIQRHEVSNGSGIYAFENVDGVAIARYGGDHVGASNSSYSLNLTGEIATGGRHWIHDWFQNTSGGGLTVFNTISSLQVGFTTGRILN